MSADATPRTVRGRGLQCPVCAGTSFRREEHLFSTRSAALLNLEWINQPAVTFVCSGCEHILWFARDPEVAS